MALVPNLRLVVDAQEELRLWDELERPAVGCLAFTVSQPVSDFTSSSFSRPCLATSLDVTNRLPASDAFWYSDIESDQLAAGNGTLSSQESAMDKEKLALVALVALAALACWLTR